MKKKKPMFKKLTPLKPNKGIQSDYYKFMVFMAEQIKRRFENVVLAGLNKQSVKEVIHDDSILSRINELFREAERKVRAQFHVRRLLAEVKKQVDRTDHIHQQGFKKAVDYGFGIDISKMPEFNEYRGFINSAIKKNLKKIKSLRDFNLTQLETELRTAIEQGKSIREISSVIQSQYKATKKKAAFIAREEIKNVTSMLTEKRMKNAGLNLYEWQTAEDERVRGNPSGLYPHAKDSHYMMNGLICDFNDPTIYSKDGMKWLKRTESMPKYHPGQAYGCRCVPVPYVPID